MPSFEGCQTLKTLLSRKSWNHGNSTMVDAVASGSHCMGFIASSEVDGVG